MTDVEATKRSSLTGAYVLFVLFMVQVVAVIDRQILSVLAEPIKAELQLSDGQFGALTGLAFGLVYAVAAIPLARIADRWSRPLLMAICIAVWSAATAASGAAANFVQMFFARVGVGIGEAGAFPATHAMISDHFRPKARATALAIVGLGGSTGIAAGVAVSGWLYTMVGWRGAMLAVAIPGVFVALLLAATVRDSRRSSDAHLASDELGFPAVLRLMRRTPSILSIALGATAVQFAVAGVSQWIPPYLMRVHGMQISQMAVLGGILGVAGVLGGLGGGLLGDQLLRRDARAYPLLMAGAMALSLPAFLCIIFANSAAMALIAVFAMASLTHMTSAPAFASIQGLAPPHMRATLSACCGLLVALGGIALGPFVVGVGSDLAVNLGLSDSLRWAFLAPAVAVVAAVILFLRAAATMSADVAAAQAAIPPVEAAASAIAT